MSVTEPGVWGWGLALFLGIGAAGWMLMRWRGRDDAHFLPRYGLQGLLVLGALGPAALGPRVLFLALLGFALFAALEVRAVLCTAHSVPRALAGVSVLILAAAQTGHLSPLLLAPSGLSLGLFGAAVLVPFGFSALPSRARALAAGAVVIAWPLAHFLAALPLVDRPSAFREVAFVYGAVEVNDSVAFLVGRAFGRHKLAPRLSPQKTWEGFAAGLCGASLSGWALAFCLPSFPPATCTLLAAGFACAGVLGDLSASALKRAQDVKDYGSWLGPHGGLVDAYDAYWAGLSALVVFLWLSAAA